MMQFRSSGWNSGRGRQMNICVAVVVALATATLSLPAAASAAPLPLGPVYGDTLDDATSSYSSAVAGSRHAQMIGRTLTHRVVIDAGTTASDYAPAIHALSPVSHVMAELFDSSDVKRTSQAAYTARASEYISAFGSEINIYEIGNEINGEWLGTPASVVAKQYAAYQKVKAAGLKTALTGYYNPDCWSNQSHAMLPWLAANIPADEKAGLDFVLVSYYEVDCNNHRPTQTEWTSIFAQLHTMFPNARLGIGEVGLSTAVGSSATRLAKAMNILTYYYGLVPRLPDPRIYVRGGFWWYGQNDLYPYTTRPLWTTFENAIRSY